MISVRKKSAPSNIKRTVRFECVQFRSLNEISRGLARPLNHSTTTPRLYADAACQAPAVAEAEGRSARASSC